MDSINYALVLEEGQGGGNDDGCNWGLDIEPDGTRHSECFFTTKFAIIHLWDDSEPDTPEGFHAGHYCHLHGVPALKLFEHYARTGTYAPA